MSTYAAGICLGSLKGLDAVNSRLHEWRKLCAWNYDKRQSTEFNGSAFEKLPKIVASPA